MDENNEKGKRIEHGKRIEEVGSNMQEAGKNMVGCGCSMVILIILISFLMLFI